MEYKTWAQARVDIVEVLSRGSSGNIGETSIKSGLQLQTTISHYPSPVFSVAHHEDSCNGIEYYVVNYVSSGGESVIAEWRYNPEEQSLRIQRKFTVRNYLKQLIWIANQRAYVGYCDDMTLRGYKGTNMEEKVRISLPHSALCIIYLQDLDELITAGQGHVISWRLGKIDFGRPFEWKEIQIDCDVNDDFDIWVTKLTYVKSKKTLMVLSEQAVYIINMKTRKQVDIIWNTHDASLTCCAYYPIFSYFISAARDGSIHVLHTVMNTIVHKFSGHRDGLTGVACMHTHPILVSWSHTTGCVRMWRLDTLELCSESALAERITNLWMEREGRLFYQTESEIRLFDINVIYTMTSTLSALVLSMKMCSVKTEMRRPQKKSGDFKIDPESAALLGSNNVTVVKQSNVLTSENVEKGDNQISMITRHRLMCVLDDRCIMTVSPESGSVTQIIYPMTDRDKEIVRIDLNKNGRSCFALLQTGDVVEFDCTVNPGRIQNPAVSQSKSQKVTCIAAFEAEVEISNAISGPTTASVCSLLIGYENGYLQLYKNGLEISTGAFVDLNVEQIKIHSGSVNHLFVPSEKQLQFLSCLRKEQGSSCSLVGNMLITIGSDLVVNIWLLKFYCDESQTLTMTLQKLSFLHLVVAPTFITAVDDVIVFSLKGTVVMYRMHFKMKNLADQSSPYEIILGRLESIPVDYELRHRAPITSVSESDILQLFATSGKNEVIKIWDLNGLLIREIDIGDGLSSVCFSNGRDLLASLRNHIVRIDACRYLPFDDLEALLDYDEKYCIKDVEPERPLPMDANSTVIACAVPAFNLISKSVPRPPNKIEDSEESERKNKIDSLRAHRKRSTKITLGEDFRRRIVFGLEDETVSDDDDRDEDGKEMEAPQTYGPPTSFPCRGIQDIVLPDHVLEKMKLCPVAPDGYIPNSVIRQRIKSIYPSILDKYFIDLYEIAKGNNLGYSEAKKMLCRLKEDSLKQLQDGKRKEKETIRLIPSQYQFLDDILKSVSLEKWCSLSLDIYNLDRSLKYLAELLKTSSNLVAMRICAAVMKIHDECKKISQYATTQDQQIEGLSMLSSGVSHSSQKAITSNLLPFLKTKCSELRQMAGCLLSMFDETITIDCVVSFLRPIVKELAEVIQGKPGAIEEDLLNLITTAISTVDSKLLRLTERDVDFSVNLETNAYRDLLQNKMIRALTSVGLTNDVAKLWTSCITTGGRPFHSSLSQNNMIKNGKPSQSNRNAIIPSAKAVHHNVARPQTAPHYLRAPAYHDERKDGTPHLPVVQTAEVFKSPSVEDQSNLGIDSSNITRSSISSASTSERSVIMKGFPISKDPSLTLDVLPLQSSTKEVSSYQNEALCVVRAFSRRQRRINSFIKHEYKEITSTSKPADKHETIPKKLAHHAEHLMNDLTTYDCPNNDITMPEGFTKAAVVDADSDDWRIILGKLRQTRLKLMPEMMVELQNGKLKPAVVSNNFSTSRITRNKKAAVQDNAVIFGKVNLNAKCIMLPRSVPGYALCRRANRHLPTESGGGNLRKSRSLKIHLRRQTCTSDAGVY